MVRSLLIAALLFPGIVLAYPTVTVKPDLPAGRHLIGLQSPPVRGAPEDVARSWLLTHRDEVGLVGQELELVRVLRTKLGTVVRFQATVDGLPVLDANVAVALTFDNRVRRVASDAQPIHGVERVRNITGQQALNAAAVDVPMVHHSGRNALGEFREVLYVEHGVARLAYEVHLATVDLVRNLYAVVDAATGEVKARSNRIFFDGPSDAARVFRTSPGSDASEPLETVTLSGLPAERDPDGYLVGELIDAFNCCTTENCDPSAGPKRIVTSLGQESLDSVLCDMQQTASNVRDRITGEPRTDYDYASPSPLTLDPPTGKAGTHPGDGDTFAEVHVFHHATRAYEFFRTWGAEDFLLRDGRRNPPRKTQVWANYLTQDYSSLRSNGSTWIVDDFARVDNAAFMPREGWQGTGAPAGTYPDSDALLLFQGTRADFGYDGDVVYHELTHGVVFATAGFNGLKFDRQTVLDEGGALHEAFADYFAAAISGDSRVGEYVGVRIPVNPNAPPAEGALRDLDNDFSCPSVLVGEVHADSKHFSGALWSIRSRLAADDPHRFDSAVFDALVSLVGSSGFEETANAVADSAATAFPSNPNAREQALEEFRRRGVIGCDKALEYTGKRAFYSIQGTNTGFNPMVPGPIQFKFRLPHGATELRFSARVESGQRRPSVQLLASRGRKLTFNGLAQLNPDAEFRANSVYGDRMIGASMLANVACGEEVYVTLANLGRSQLTLSNLTFNATPLESCPTTEPEPEPQPEEDPPPAEEPVVIEESGCGCGTAGASPLALIALVASFGLVRRRR